MQRPIEKFLDMVGPTPKPRRFDVQARRNAMEDMAARLPPPDDVSFAAATIAGVSCEWVTVPETRDDHVVVWVHGGGFSAGSCRTHRGIAGEIARHANARVLTIDYRLSPEHVFPAALDDVISVYNEVACDTGLAKLGLAGDSAGCALTLRTAIDARDNGVRGPDALALFSPWLDLRCVANSFQSKTRHDPMIHPDILRMLAADYLGGHSAEDPRASPLLAGLAGLPPILVQTGSNEVLLDDTLALDRLGRDAGVEISLEIWSEMVHVFQAYRAFLPEADAALKRTGEFLKSIWNSK